MPGTPALVAYCCSICQTTFSDMVSPCTLSPRFTGRNTLPSTKPAAEVQAWIATFTQVGIGTVRTRACLPTRSTMHQRPSRCWICPSMSAATSERRSPHPSTTARIARSRRPFTVEGSGVFRSVCGFPQRQPVADADADRFRALHAGDAGRQFRREQPVVRCLGSQLANR
jgi:hypothetical protein